MAFCPTGGGGCAEVQNSRRLELLGIYIPYLAYLGVAMTSYVLYLQAFVIETWCPWCLISTALMRSIAGLASWSYVRGAPPAGALRPSVTI